MRKITLNRTRLSNVVDNQINMSAAQTDSLINKAKRGLGGFRGARNEKRVRDS